MGYIGVITHLLTIDPNFLGHPSGHPCTLTIGLGSCNNSATAAAVEEEVFFSCPSARQAAEATEGQGSFLKKKTNQYGGEATKVNKGI